MSVLLRLANIEKSYVITKAQKQHVLKGVSCELDRGELVALVGESGSGKSTLMNILGGLDQDYTGSIVVKGQFIRDFTEKQMDDYRKKRVGLVFQNYNLIAHMTIAENIEIAMQMSDVSESVRKQRCLELLQLIGLSEHAGKLPSQLSGGQQQRVSIARALANNPSIVLADEPTGALDKDSAEIVLQILKKIVESGKLVIIVTHSEVVAKNCSRVIHLDNGVIISDEVKFSISKKSEFEKVIMPKPIKTKELAKLSYRNLKQTSSRSILVSIGMSIGIAAMIVILSLGNGLKNYVQTVYADNLQSTLLSATQDSINNEINSSIYNKIDNISGITSIYPSMVITSATSSYEELSIPIDGLTGYYSDYYPVLLYGTIRQDDGGILINETFASELSPTSLIALIGQDITIHFMGNATTFKITGIYDDLTSNPDGLNVLISGEDLLSITGDSFRLNTVYIATKNVSYVNSVLSDLKALGLTVYQEDSSATTVMDYIDIGAKVLSGISVISMIVAAIMIFIVLYISIVERTKEIGILRAIGAQKKDIRKLFMFEAAMLGISGGVIGLILSLTIAVSTNSITYMQLKTNLISYNIGFYLLGLLLSITISVLAGIAPSIKASELDPVEALRYE